MAQAKVELKVGLPSFSSQAESGWLEKQLDKLLDYAKSVDGSEGGAASESASAGAAEQASHSRQDGKVPLGTLHKQKTLLLIKPGNSRRQGPNCRNLIRRISASALAIWLEGGFAARHSSFETRLTFKVLLQ